MLPDPVWRAGSVKLLLLSLLLWLLIVEFWVGAENHSSRVAVGVCLVETRFHVLYLTVKVCKYKR